MKIKLSSKVIEYRNLESLRDAKIKGPASNIYAEYEVSYFSNNTFVYNNSNIFLHDKGKEKMLSPKDRFSGIELEGKVLLCQLGGNSKTTRIFVTPNHFIFEQTIKENIIQHLAGLKFTDTSLFNSIVTYLGNKKWSGERITDDAYDIMNFFMASNTYSSQVEDIMVDYNLFREIMFVETML